MSFEPADGVANHTYSCHQRGLEEFNVTYQLLDRVPAALARPARIAGATRRSGYQVRCGFFSCVDLTRAVLGQSDRMKLSISWNGDGWANTVQSASRPLKGTVLISHGENARRIGRIRPGPALSGALRAERTPHFAWSFSLLQNVDRLITEIGH
jgi:Bacterial protein of unknown function (DUF899)